MTPIDVACATEGARYVGHCATMLRSLLVAHPEGVRVHYFHGPDMTERQRRRLRGMVERDHGTIEFIGVEDSLLAGLPTQDFTRKATWYRIFLPDLLPALDRVLYLDSDLLVAEPLHGLWETELGDDYLAAVTNVLEPMYAERPAQLGIDDPHRYFNAGVLLLNLASMRRDGCTETMRAYGVSEAPRLLWRDQDALNVVLGGRRVALHPRWNSMNIFRFPWAGEVFGADVLREAIDRPAIRHFEGPGVNKPWFFGAELEQRRLYAAHRRATPWPRYVPEGMTARKVLGRVRRRLASLSR